MVNSRVKGAAAERELFKLIGEALGIEVKRNLVQTREGGYDTLVGRWAIEVKRQETSSLDAWWEQTVSQAKDGNLPMLVYRRSRQPWRVRVRARDYLCLHGAVSHSEAVLETDLQEGIDLMKLTIPGFVPNWARKLVDVD